MPTRLKRFIERSEDDKPTGRVAYVLKIELLDAPLRGNRWHPDPSFNAAEALLEDASLKDIYRSALDEGIAFVVKHGL